MGLTTLSLFSGVGALCCLGIDSAGLAGQIVVTQFVEVNFYRQQVLANHYPLIPCHDDIRTYSCTAGQFDIVVGGSPCQGISGANSAGTGFGDERSRLWWEMYRLIKQCRPKFVLWENVGRARYPRSDQSLSPLGAVLWSLTQIGFGCEWFSCTAAQLGAPHLRERIFVVAYADGAQSSSDNLPDSRTRQVGTPFEEILPTRSNQSAQRSGVDDGSSLWLGQYQPGGWWRDRPLPTTISAPVRSIPLRHAQISAIGDSCTPQQAAVAWSRLVQFLK